MAQPSIAVKDSGGNVVTVFTQNTNGQSTSINSQPVVLASDQASLPTTSSNPIAILAGQQAGTAAAVALPANVLVNGAIVTALSTNIGTIYVGPAGVTTSTGYPLAAGQSISYGVTNMSAIFIIGAVGSVAWTGN